MKNGIATSLTALLALSGLASAQALIEKTGSCPTLTRSSVYNGQTVSIQAPAWGGGRPSSTLLAAGEIQNPLSPNASINCLQVPAGLKAQIVASEMTPGPYPQLGYLMHFTFDERGRVWAIDSRDYPYTHDSTAVVFSNPPTGTGRITGGKSRVVILEDTNGDGALDNYKVFYTGLAIPTSIEIVKNGVILTVPPYVVFLQKSNSNPDTAAAVSVATGSPNIVVSGMGSTGADFDSHFQTNSLTRGLDNWIYGHSGSNGCGPAAMGSNPTVSCSGGNIYRFKATSIGSDTTVFQMVDPSGPSNAHGIGQMEDGQWFKSGATCASHSNHNVRFGIAGVSILSGTGPNCTTTSAGDGHVYYPLTDDGYYWEGSNTATRNGFRVSTSTATSGHDFYTARLLPQKYWNRFGFACDGSTKLCNMDSLVESGSTWNAIRLPGPGRSNIFASTDAWTAPLKVRTGPDGALWVLDWYSYLFLHNPAQPATNGGYRHPLRSKFRTRLYRLVPAAGNTEPVLNLVNRTNADLVGTFWNSNFLWRMQAQRLLVERGYTSELGDLLDSVLTRHRTVDAVGIDGPILHAIWTLHGLKRLDIDSARWNPKLKALLLHPAWTVRRNVALAMPGTAASSEAIKAQCAVNDVHAHVRVQALQNLTRMPAPPSGAMTSVDGLRTGDTHITAAYAAAGTGKVTTVTGSARPTTCPAYMGTAPDSAGYPGLSVGVRNLRTHGMLAVPEVRFDLRANGFNLIASENLMAGEIAVTDLRGHTVFRSTYNAATRTWSQASAKDMPQPFYFYTFRGLSGAKFNGRIAMSQSY